LETQTQVETQHKHTKNEIKPITVEYAPSYAVYIQLLEDVNLIEELEISLHDFIKFVQNIPWTNLITATQRENGLLKTSFSI
jgi:hypothetical protein